MANKIRVAIVGVGNCAKSLVEGIQYYIENPQDSVGLMYPDIGGYGVGDIQFVCGFDVDIRKVNKTLKEALRAKPNCAMDHVKEISDACIEPGAMVYSGPELDGIAPWMREYPEAVSFRTGAIPAEPFERVVDLFDVIHCAVRFCTKSFFQGLVNLANVNVEAANELNVSHTVTTDVRIHQTNRILRVFDVVLDTFD
jgi:myo-inositol-1-phosphate synthase